MTAQSTPVREAIDDFNDAFARLDVDAIMALMTEDCVFEDTTPPDGRRHEGQTEVRAVWEELFASTNEPRIEVEEIEFVAGDRAVQRWVYRWTPEGDGPDHVRGVDVLRLRDGLVAEKLSYVKG